MRLLAFRLARELGRTVDELLNGISAAELNEWAALFAIEANDGQPIYPDVEQQLFHFFSANHG